MPDSVCNYLQTCGSEYPICFCQEICTLKPSTRKYVYFVCSKKECNYISIRCNNCLKMCGYEVSNNDSKLFWCYKNDTCDFFKQFLEKKINLSLVNTLCTLIFKQIDFEDFKCIVKKLYKNERLDIDIVQATLVNLYGNDFEYFKDLILEMSQDNETDEASLLVTPTNNRIRPSSPFIVAFNLENYLENQESSPLIERRYLNAQPQPQYDDIKSLNSQDETDKRELLLKAQFEEMKV